jgi:1-aminocyclopropane-1-carboxylate synthase
VVLCNPNNPLGRCYEREVLVGLVSWAEGKGVHVVSDEIYGLSVYMRVDRTNEKFTSVLSLTENEVSGDWLRKGVHVLYGLSKVS